MWFDLGAPNAGQAREFYSAMFGWAVAPAADAGPYRGLDHRRRAAVGRHRPG